MDLHGQGSFAGGIALTERIHLLTRSGKKELQFELANYLDEDGWNYVNGISHGCTKLVDPEEIAEHKELNYLILQACNYYELADKERWTSPLLTAMRENKALPTTKPGKFIAPASQHHVPNYQAIDTMVDFATTKTNTMEETWLESVSTATNTKTGNSDLKTTMELVRTDVIFKEKRPRL